MNGFYVLLLDCLLLGSAVLVWRIGRSHRRKPASLDVPRLDGYAPRADAGAYADSYGDDFDTIADAGADRDSNPDGAAFYLRHRRAGARAVHRDNNGSRAGAAPAGRGARRADAPAVRVWPSDS